MGCAVQRVSSEQRTLGALFCFWLLPVVVAEDLAHQVAQWRPQRDQNMLPGFGGVLLQIPEIDDAGFYIVAVNVFDV